MDDWTTRPFVDIILTKVDDGGCPLDYEPMFYREWEGTYDVCDGIDGLSVYDAKAGCDGTVIDSIPPVNMTAMTGLIACGKRGGPNFLETIRPDPYTLECPRNYIPCSKFTPANDTVCVKEYERDFECPIIDLFIIHV